jgi:hypothetical protein
VQPRARQQGTRDRPVGEGVEHTEIGRALIGPAQLLLDPTASDATHGLTPVVVVKKLYDRPGAGRYVAALDVDRGLSG